MSPSDAHPATHAGVGNPGGGPAHSPFYGMRMRLRPTVTSRVLRSRDGAEKGTNETAVDVVLTAMQTVQASQGGYAA